MRKYDTEPAIGKYADLAATLNNDGLVVVKNFLDKDELTYLISKYGSKQKLSLLDSGHEYHKFYVKYFHPQSKACDFYAKKIIIKAMAFRNKVLINENFDQFLLEYCQIFQIDPKDSDAVIHNQCKHTFARFALYSQGQGQMSHFDNPGEIQIIIPLSKYSVDYLGGLMANTHTGEELCVDEIVNTGDMVLLNAYKLKHRVLPIESLTENGRQHLFIATVPWYLYPQAYYFKGNLLKPFMITASIWAHIMGAFPVGLQVLGFQRLRLKPMSTTSNFLKKIHRT